MSIFEIEQPDDRNTQDVHSTSTCQPLKLNNQMIQTHKMYIYNVITMISASNFYVSKTSVSTSISPTTHQMPPCHSAPRDPTVPLSIANILWSRMPRQPTIVEEKSLPKVSVVTSYVNHTICTLIIIVNL
jgi:hypothetical protein